MTKHTCPFENCTSTFSRPYRLQIHIQRHRGLKEFQCDQCDRGYHRRQHLQRHVAEAHQTEPRLKNLLNCDHCQRQFSTAWGLRRHQRNVDVQRKIRMHRCETCGRKFHRANELEIHSLKHERFQCLIPSCPWLTHKFNWAFYHQHMADYHSEPFECEHCGERFLKKSQIRLHVEQHMPKFTCTQSGCNKTFTRSKNLNQHILIGHGERTHKCQVVGCDWAFKYKACLNRHIKAHQKNGRIVSMAKRTKKKEPKFVMANKLAVFALKI